MLGRWGWKWEEGIGRESGVDINTPVYLKWIMNKSYHIARGTLLNVIWQPG